MPNNQNIADLPPVAPIRVQRSPKKQIEKAQSETLRLIARMELAVVRGDRKCAFALQRKLLRSRSGKVAAMFASCETSKRKGRPFFEGQQLLLVADGLSCIREPVEGVRLHAKRKSIGFRPIHAYGTLNHARQILVDWALTPFVRTDPRQFTRLGCNRAIEAVLALLPTHRFMVEIDIDTFYSSIDRDWLRQHLPIAEEITDSVILSEDVTQYSYTGLGSLRRLTCPVSLLNASRQGLPQGARTSPIVAEFVVAEIMKVIPDRIAVVNIADNFLVMARTRREMNDALKTLCTAIEQCPAGRFKLTVSKVRRAQDGIEFLGYNVRSLRGKVTATACNKNRTKFQREVFKLLAGRQGDEEQDRQLAKYVNGWLAGHSVDEHRHFFALNFLGRLAEATPALRGRMARTWRSVVRAAPAGSILKDASPAWTEAPQDGVHLREH